MNESLTPALHTKITLPGVANVRRGSGYGYALRLDPCGLRALFRCAEFILEPAWLGASKAEIDPSETSFTGFAANVFQI